MSAVPSPPKGTRAAGRRLWDSIVCRFDLEERELAILREACRLVDDLGQLHAVVQRDGVTVPDRSGASQVHPALVEARQSRLALARLLAALRVPDTEDVRPQRRGGARGFYTLPRGGRETA